VELQISPQLRRLVEDEREWGRLEARPAGLEADRAGAPLRVDHPYFQKFVDRSLGRPDRLAGLEPAPEGRVTQMVVLGEESAYWDRGMGVAAPGAGAPSGMVNAAGTPEQKQRFLGPFVRLSSPRWASFALTEPTGGSDTAAFRTHARRTDAGYVLNGAKCFIGNAQRADWILVQATLDPARGRAAQRAFFVQKDTPGLTGMRVENKMGLRSYESVSFILDNCEVPASQLLGGEPKDSQVGAAVSGDYSATMGALNAGRLAVAASALGVARAAYDEARSFATESGVLKTSRVRDKLEGMLRKLRAARLMTLQAAWQLDNHTTNIVACSMAKIVTAEVAQELAALGMEIVGLAAAAGGGLIEKLFRDAKALNIVEGTGQIQRVIMARKLVGLPR
jgi:acyl-CoA dehydrogenase